MSIFFEVGATACRVDDNYVTIIWLKYINIMTGELSSTFCFTCVNMQSSATLLPGRCYYFTSVCRQYTNSCFVNIAVNLIHDASANKSYTVTFFRQCGRNLRQ